MIVLPLPDEVRPATGQGIRTGGGEVDVLKTVGDAVGGAVVTGRDADGDADRRRRLRGRCYRTARTVRSRWIPARPN